MTVARMVLPRQRNATARCAVSTDKAETEVRMAGFAQPYARRGVGVSWLLVIYLVAGGIVAATHDYWSNVHTLKAIFSAILATVLWPLILIGINLHIT